DGAYDMAIIAHEYTHATTNRMTGGPDGSLGGGQSGNMGEAWSDLAAIEYLQSFGLTPVGRESPFAMSVYATGDTEAGIRNYAIDQSPLNFSNFQYDPNGLTTPHADSEIFGAVQYSLRKTLIEKYQAEYPFEDRELQIDCAEGRLSAQVCPGNRRWVQMMFDALLIQPAGPSMLDNRDATLASNLVRFDGADLVELWDAYASRGQGEKAFTIDRSDVNPRPDFSSPMHENEADIVFATLADDGSAPVANIYVGRYEARSVPIGDTNPNGGFPGAHRFVPGRYEFFVQANGYGLTRFVEEFQPGESRTLTFSLRRNLASHHNGAVASGVADSDADLLELIDDTESTNWQSTDAALAEGKAEGEFVEGRAVTVRLSERATVSDVQVSAFLTPDGQNRFTALRSFDIAACDAQRADCTQDAAFTTVYRSPDDAFEGGFLRPKAPRLQLKSFDIPDTLATHLRLIVRDSQCTGAPQYQGEAHPSGDPTNDPDCDTGMNLQLTLLGLPEFSSNVPNEIRISEFQAFVSPASGRSEPDTGARSGLVTRGGSLGWMLLILLPLLARRRA
ncbi:MAG: M36 family metallopeptidase, partial [Oceanococcaceae bacterium]